MRDAHSPEDMITPQDDWGQALAAMPLETPPAGGWERLSTRLPRRRSPARYWLPAAIAASLAVLIVWPWKAQDSRESQTPAIAHTTTPVSPPSIAATDSSATTTTPRVTEATTTAPATDRVAEASTGTPIKQTPPASHATAAPSPRLIAKAANAGDAAARQPAAALAELDQAGVPSSYATNDNAPATTDDSTQQTASTVDASATPAVPTLENLYAESARLEALLSQIRDDRVSSGTAMALSADLHDRMAGIDVALSQPDVSADTRLNLWRERVATLQRLTGVETTQRWMAANGYRADGQVAQVY